MIFFSLIILLHINKQTNKTSPLDSANLAAFRLILYSQPGSWFFSSPREARGAFLLECISQAHNKKNQQRKQKRWCYVVMGEWDTLLTAVFLFPSPKLMDICLYINMKTQEYTHILRRKHWKRHSKMTLCLLTRILSYKRILEVKEIRWVQMSVKM